jgi:hypothetical protein
VLFDLGALGLNADLSSRASPRYVGRSEQGERLVYDLKGRALFDAAPTHPTPSSAFTPPLTAREVSCG